MTDAVPPAKQCTMPDCSREAVDPTNAAGLCPEHAPDVSRDERAKPPADNPVDGGSPAATPTLEPAETGSTTGDATATLADALAWFHRQLDRDLPRASAGDASRGWSHPAGA